MRLISNLIFCKVITDKKDIGAAKSQQGGRTAQGDASVSRIFFACPEQNLRFSDIYFPIL